jgi:hypothetical protein
MRSGLALILLALIVPGCAGSPASSSGPTQAPAISPSANPTASPQAQPFNLSTHCGILTTYFAGRMFYLAALYPARVAFSGTAGRPDVAGTITLLSPHVAAFVDSAGNRILYVDQLPGALNTPYPFVVHVLSGGNQLGDEQFAGRHWRTAQTLPGVSGPPYGNGQDSSTPVGGTFTIIDAQNALFRSQAGAMLHYTALPPMGCD